MLQRFRPSGFFLLVLSLLAGCGKAESPGPAKEKSGASQTPDKISGIDEPLVLQGINLSVKSAKKVPSYDVGGVQTIRPKSNDDILVVVTGEATGSDVQKAVDGWKGGTSLKDSTGKECQQIVTMKGTHPSKPNLVTINWLFSAPKSAQSLILYLPEGKKVPLDSLLKKGD